MLWAKKNLGAATEEDAGLYFQWGDTVGYTAEQVGDGDGLKYFDWNTYKFSNDGSDSNLSKYNKTDGKTVLDLEDDATHVLMGGNWRMPTNEDFQELINNTDLYLISESGEEIHGNVDSDGVNSYTSIYVKWEQAASGVIKGMKFYKKDGKQTYLFVPCGGIANGGSVRNVGAIGYLRSSSLFFDVRYAWSFGFSASDGGYVSYGYGYNKSYGFPVRGILAQ